MMSEYEKKLWDELGKDLPKPKVIFLSTPPDLDSPQHKFWKKVYEQTRGINYDNRKHLFAHSKNHE